LTWISIPDIVHLSTPLGGFSKESMFIFFWATRSGETIEENRVNCSPPL